MKQRIGWTLAVASLMCIPFLWAQPYPTYIVTGCVGIILSMVAERLLR